MRQIRLVAGWMVAVVAVLVYGAQAADEPAPAENAPAASEPPPRRVPKRWPLFLGEDSPPVCPAWNWSFAIRFSRMQKFSGAFDLILGKYQQKFLGMEITGAVAEFEYGMGGLKVGLGYAYLGRALGVLPIVMPSVRAAVFYSHGVHLYLPQEQTYAGVEAEFRIYGTGIIVGVFFHVAGSDPTPAAIFNIGIMLWV